jgi:signal transduction histidine kinase
MPETSQQSEVVTAQQMVELRRVCEQLAYIGGGSLPPDLDSLPSLITAMTFLTEICSKRLSRSREHEPVADAQHDLENLERLKARFIRNVSHELRTPLACIDGFARALQQMEKAEVKEVRPAVEGGHESLTNDTRQQFLHIISQEAQRLGKLIDDVLDLSEVESNRRKRQAVVFSAGELFEEVMRPLANAPITFRLKPEKIGPMIYADREMMIEALRELAVNALKFSNGQPVVLGAETVSIGPDRSTQASESGLQQRVTTATQLYVKDKGVGIPSADLQHIFEKFYRVETTAASFPGTGLGLAIVRALVAQNYGQVWADSDFGNGSTFYILIPDRSPGTP